MPEDRIPSRVQARDEPCADPARCDIHGEKPTQRPHWADLLAPAEEPQPHEQESRDCC